jgi:hypothetical protein
VKILVPCSITGLDEMAALYTTRARIMTVPGPGWGSHYIDVAVGTGHVVKSIRGCASMRELRAIEALHDSPLFTTCRLSIELLYSVLKSGMGANDLAWTVVRCQTCQSFVLPLDRMKSTCPCCSMLAARDDSEVWTRVMEAAAKLRDRRRHAALERRFRFCPRTITEALAA